MVFEKHVIYLLALALTQQMATGSGIQDGKHIVHQIGSMLQYRQSRIPVWFDSNQCHRLQTDKWKTVCSLAGTHTAPLPIDSFQTQLFILWWAKPGTANSIL